MGPLAVQRRSLPVFSYRTTLLETLRAHSVVVVEGETGSGKTTQVPQYVLEEAAARGEPCNIVVAQPRRISAMSVAERVAVERGEAIGGTVGYTIPNEPHAELAHDREGLLCMATEGEDGNGAQFFITDGATPDLDEDDRFTIFGRCRNTDIVERIARVPQEGEENRPRTDVMIERVRVRRVRGGAANAVRTPPQLPEGMTPEDLVRSASPGPNENAIPGRPERHEGASPFDPRTFRRPGEERQRVEGN